MDIREFEFLAREHLRKLVLWFVTWLVVTVGSYAIAEWAYESRGWQSEVVGFLFYALFALSAILTIILGTSVYSWFAGYKAAKSDASHFELHDLQKWRSGVVGPFRWM